MDVLGILKIREFLDFWGVPKMLEKAEFLIQFKELFSEHFKIKEFLKFLTLS